TTLGPTGQVEWIPPPALERGQPRVNPYHFIDDVINHLRGTQPDDAADPDADGGSLFEGQPPPPIDTEPDWPWLDDPLPGDPDYDTALDDLQRSFEAIDLDELAKRHVFADDDWVLVR
ncbi:MAG: hypothetical protein ABI253_14805, partial [Mycobacterium sp.]